MTQNYSTVPLVAVIDAAEADLTATRTLLIDSARVQVVGTATQLAEMKRFAVAEPDLVLLDVSATQDDIPSAIRQVRELAPQCEVILTTSPGIIFDLAEAVLAGARGLIRKPIAADQILSLIQSVFDAEQTKRRHLESMAKAGPEQARTGEVITLYSPKGGVGCTTIAANLAIALRELTGARVALVDFDLQFGDVDVLLNLQSSHSIHELVRSTDDLDMSIMDAVMVKHQSGISVLLAPPSLDLVEDLAPHHLVAVLKALRKNYDYVVVDTWSSLEEATLAVMEVSDTVLLVTTPELPALRDLGRLLDLLDTRHNLKSKTKVLINRYPSKNAVSLAQIERSLALTPLGTIPSDGHLLTMAVNEGVSFMAKPGEAAKGLKDVATSLSKAYSARVAKSSGPPPEKRRLLPTFKKTQTEVVRNA